MARTFTAVARPLAAAALPLLLIATASASVRAQEVERPCTNPALDYTVSYRSDWYANEAVSPDDEALDPIAECQYFGEEPFDLQPNAGIPPTVAIGFSRAAEMSPPSTGATVISTRETTVDGRRAIVREDEEGVDSAFFAAGDRHYRYFVALETGAYLVAGTGSPGPGDYEAHKEVLDRMMEGLSFGGIELPDTAVGGTSSGATVAGIGLVAVLLALALAVGPARPARTARTAR